MSDEVLVVITDTKAVIRFGASLDHFVKHADETFARVAAVVGKVN